MSAAPVLVEILRGTMVENVHRGHVAVVDSAGNLLFRCGEPGGRFYWRSSAKPFQALPLVETGAADHYGLSDADLAICCGSHIAQPMHVEQALSVLSKANLSPTDLRCGPHLPEDRQEAESLIRRGERPNVLHSNCSGKHSGMVALARFQSAPLDGYPDPSHPVQQAILANISAMAGLNTSEIVLGTDGCGVPTYGLPLSNMALAFARLADPVGLAPAKQEAARRIGRAMMAHPALVAGPDRFDTDIMTQAPGLLSKGGAAGIFCVGVTPQRAAAAGLGSRGLGIAVKIEDGNGAEPRPSSGIEALRQLGLISAAELDALRRHYCPPVRDLLGRTIGAMRTVYRLESVAPKAR